jgi:hypothetical protein
MKHKPDQAFGHWEVFCFFLALFVLAGERDRFQIHGRRQRGERSLHHLTPSI